MAGRSGAAQGGRHAGGHEGRRHADLDRCHPAARAAGGVSGRDCGAAADRHPIRTRFLRSHAGARSAATSAKVMPMSKKTEANGTNGADTQLRRAAEALFAHELQALVREDDRARPAGGRLSPRAVVTYLMGGKTRSGGEITPKYIGNRRLIETAVATLATDRALLLLGVPGTAKSWVSEHLAAAVTGSSQLIVQCTAGHDQNQ